MLTMIPLQLGEHQLVQSHTPLRDFIKDWKDRPVLVIGGLGDAARKIAESYGMKQAYILQDLLAWNPSLWDRYRLSEEEKAFVKVRPVSPPHQAVPAQVDCSVTSTFPQSTWKASL